MATGRKTGGRKKGSVNKSTKLLKGDPLTSRANLRLSQIIDCKLPCQTCHGKGRTKYQPANGEKIFERRCESCYGDGLEKLSPELIAKVALALRREVVPELKAIEISNPDGTLRPSWEVVILEAKNDDVATD